MEVPYASKLVQLPMNRTSRLELGSMAPPARHVISLLMLRKVISFWSAPVVEVLEWGWWMRTLPADVPLAREGLMPSTEG